MVLFHILGVGTSLQLGGGVLSWTSGAGPAATDAGLARKPAKIYASEPPARQATMIHGIPLWLCSGRSSVRFGGFASFGGADVPSMSAALTGGRYDSLAVSAGRSTGTACELSSSA